ncbi:MAG: prephenate dehydrogenase/arogenate dehydrogenase family protein [Promethearchaeota archaeon]
MNKRWEIAIVGGTGGMGQVFTKELKAHADIIIISRSLEKAKKFSEKLGVRYGILKDCNTADIIIISVPIKNTYEICQKLFKFVKPNSLIMDISAVKTHLKKIKLEIPNRVSYISIHPLFGPEGTFKDYNVILVPLKGDNWLSIIQELFDNIGAITSTATVEEHDTIMSKIQVAHHFIYLLLASYLNDTQISPKFFTHSFQKTLETFRRIEKNLPAIMEIQQENPYAESTRKEINLITQKLISLDPEKIHKLLSKIEMFKKIYLLKKENS